jgi:sulfur-carrier protein
MHRIYIEFAAHLQRHVRCPAQTVQAATLSEALQRAFLAAPAMQHYVLTEQGHIRKHVAVFINGTLHTQRDDPQIALEDGSRVHVMQALTGG